MSSNVDLRELAYDRGGEGETRFQPRRPVLTRYVLPLVLIFGFLSLVAWASRDLIFLPTAVTVVPVFSTMAEVRQEGLPLFKAAGWIEPRPTPVPHQAALAPGVVEKLLVVEDQPVKTGEAVAELIIDDAKLVHDRTVADLELRRAELDGAKAALTAAKTRFRQPVHLDASLGEAAASLAKIETKLKNLPFQIRRAESDYEAMRRVFNKKISVKDIVSGIEIDVAKNKADAAKAFLEELRGRSDSLKKQHAALSQRREAPQTQLELLADETREKDQAEAIVKAATARVAQAGVVVAEAKLQLDRMTVVSPMDGRIFRLIAHPGTRVGSGMIQMTGYDGSTVVTLYRPDMLQVRVDVRFGDIPNVSLKQPVKIDNPALSSPLTGSVLLISSEADIQKNTLQVKVEIPDPPPVFKPEMLVDVTFLAPKQPECTTEPNQEVKLYVLQQLIKKGDHGSFVWLADQSDGMARKTAVETGPVDTKGLVEITSGLTVSSRIISDGSDGLQDGDRIRVASEDPSLGTSHAVPQRGRAGTPNRLPTGDNQ